MYGKIIEAYHYVVSPKFVSEFFYEYFEFGSINWVIENHHMIQAIFPAHSNNDSFWFWVGITYIVWEIASIICPSMSSQSLFADNKFIQLANTEALF